MTTEDRRITRRTALAGMAGATVAATAVATVPALAKRHPDAELLALEKERQRLFAVWEVSNRAYNDAEQAMWAKEHRGEPISRQESARIDALSEIEGNDLNEHDAFMDRMFEVPVHTPEALATKLRVFTKEYVTNDDWEPFFLAFVADAERIGGAS